MVVGFNNKSLRPVNVALCIFLRFTVHSMSADREVQELLREFEQRGLQNLMRNPPASVPRKETPPVPNQPMQTRSTRKKFKPEVHSKQNEDRNEPVGQTSEEPEMNPSGSVEIPPEGSQCPPYLPPV